MKLTIKHVTAAGAAGCLFSASTLLGEAVSNGAPSMAPQAPSTIDLMLVFRGNPIIYSLLILLSLASSILCIYSLLTLRLKEMMPKEFINQIRQLLSENRFETALATCQQDQNFCSTIIACGLSARKHGPQVMMEAMQWEGRRAGVALWQRISFLNEVAVISPMLGLLGTVMGLFYAFYDSQRSADSIATIFDGLGVAVGTTVAGLIVAIMAMIFYTVLKFRVTTLLTVVENEVLGLVTMIEPKTIESQAIQQTTSTNPIVAAA